MQNATFRREREFTGKVTVRGQVTVPVEVRRHLGIEDGGKLTFVVSEDGEVRVRTPKYPTVESLRGIAGKLPRPMEWDEILEIAREDAVREKFGYLFDD